MNIELRYGPTVAHLRDRAAHYRALARHAGDRAEAADYWYIAEIFDREADAQQAPPLPAGRKGSQPGDFRHEEDRARQPQQQPDGP